MITITERAAQEAVRILDEQAKPGAMVRIWIAGIGCGGFRYGLGIDERAPEPDDQVFTSGAARVVVDAGSMEHLAGATPVALAQPTRYARLPQAHVPFPVRLSGVCGSG